MAHLEHVGIAVEEIDRALRMISDILLEEAFKVESVESDGIRTHFVSGGAVQLELLERTGDDSVLTRFLERRGSGLHHLAFAVGDIQAAYDRLQAAGYEPVDDAPRPGADGKVIFFLHPRDTAGVLIEFCAADGPLLRPVSTPDISGLRSLSTRTGSSACSPLLYMYDGQPRLELETLAATLHPGRSLFAADVVNATVATETIVDLDTRALLAELDAGRLHAAADAELGRALLDIPPPRLASLTLIDPPPLLIDNVAALDPKTTILVRSGANDLRAAASLRERQPDISLCAADGAELRAMLLAGRLDAVDAA